MSIFDDINAIELWDVLSRLWIRYERHGNNLELYEWDKYTDGWRWDVNKWFIKDFAWKRAEWDRITFVMAHLWLNKWEAVDWFVEKFSLEDSKWKSNTQISISNSDIIWMLAKNTEKAQELSAAQKASINITAKWESLPDLNEQQIEYLKSRMIDAEAVKAYVKDNHWFISCAIWNEQWRMISIQWRSSWEDKAYRIEKWTNSKWCFISDINREVRKVYVVEWMSDFLTIAQFWVNTIWMKSATDWESVVIEFFNRWYEIIMIPDTDEAWQNMLSKFESIKYSLMDLKPFNVKDINELLVQSQWSWEDLLDIIEEYRTKQPKNIDSAIAKFWELKTIFQSRWWKLGIESPFPVLDKYIWWIIEGKVYTIGAYANTGKSQFSYEFAQKLLSQWKKVGYFSLEVDSWMLFSYMVKARYKEDYKSILMGNIWFKRSDFENLYIYDNIRKFDQIRKTIELEKFDVVFIDYLQAISYPWTWWEKTDNLMFDIQWTAIDNNCTVFLLSQVTNDSKWKKDWWEITLKWGGGIMSASDVVMTLAYDTWLLNLDIIKNKFGKRWTFLVNYDFDKWVYKIMECAKEWSL